MKHTKKCLVGVILSMIVGWQQLKTSSPEEFNQLPQTVQTSLVSKAGNPLRFTLETMEIMGNAEGCRKDSYQCPARIWTAGIGHTGKDVKPYNTYDDMQIAIWFASDIMTAQNCIEQNIEAKIFRKVPDSVVNGVGSFVFNVGCKRMMINPKTGARTQIFKYLLSGEWKLACNELPKYVYGAGVKLPGLVTRRGKEKRICLKDL